MPEDTYSDVNIRKAKKHQKEALISNEILMDAPIGIFTSSPEGRIISANQTLASMLGYETPRELIESITDIGQEIYANPENREYLKKILRKYGEIQNLQFKWVSRTGELFWVSIHAKAVCDDQDGLFFYQGFVVDITERKQAEEALKEQSQALNERNKELRCLYAISRLVEDQGNSIDDILQGTVNLLPDSWQYPEVACARIKFEDRVYVTRNFRETYWRQAQDIIAEKEPVGCVEIFYLEEKPPAHEGPFLSEERDLIYAIAERLGHIIGRIRAQIRLQQSEQKFRDIFNGSNDAVFIHDISGRFLEVNQVACSRLGYSREEFLRMTSMDLDADEYAGSGPQRIQDIDQQGSLTFESIHRCKDGSTIDVEISSRKINYDGKSCILSIARDITKRKQAEEELKKIEWMLSSQQESSLNSDDSSVDAYIPPYGNLTELNTSREILDAVGEETLGNIVGDFLDMLDTSVAVYEANGDYALGIFSSDWCRLMDRASYHLCGTKDREQALNCGKWLCHESCWDTAKQAIETGSPADVECEGGIRLYAVPIRASNEIIGTINVGYGDPPADISRLSELASKYGVNVKDLIECSNTYESRPPFIIELAKRRIHSAANLIGEMVERKQIKQSLLHERGFLKHIMETSPAGIIFVNREGQISLANAAAEQALGLKRSDICNRSYDDPAWHITDFEGNIYPEEKLPFQLVKKTGTPVYGIEQAIERPDAKRVLLSINAAPVFDGSGDFNGMVSVIEDVTERKQAEDKIKNLNSLLTLQRNLNNLYLSKPILSAILRDKKQKGGVLCYQRPGSWTALTQSQNSISTKTTLMISCMNSGDFMNNLPTVFIALSPEIIFSGIWQASSANWTANP